MALLDMGSFGGAPWWAFLMMPLMMLGMGLMMWLMMSMMMGVGGHGASDRPRDSSAALRGEQAAADSEVASLRRQLAELQERLAAVEASRGGPDAETSPPIVAPHEGGPTVSGKGEAP